MSDLNFLKPIFTIDPTLVNSIVSAKIVALLGFLAGVGGLSAALVKVIEDLSWIKAAVNRNFLTAWFAQCLSRAAAVDQGLKSTTKTDWAQKPIYGLHNALKAGETPKHAKPPKVHPAGGEHQPSSLLDAWNQTVGLCAAGQELALVELDVDQICGQLNSAAQIVLQYPAQYPGIFTVLTAGAFPADIATVKSAHKTEGPQSQGYIDARTRLSNYVQRTIDALHILLQARWTWWLQVAGFIFSCAITATVLLAVSSDPILGLVFWVHLIGATVVGGFLAPIARDVVMAVKGMAS